MLEIISEILNNLKNGNSSIETNDSNNEEKNEYNLKILNLIRNDFFGHLKGKSK